MKMVFEYCDACQKDITEWDTVIGGTPWEASNGCFPNGDLVKVVACSIRCLAAALADHPAFSD